MPSIFNVPMRNLPVTDDVVRRGEGLDFLGKR